MIREIKMKEVYKKKAVVFAIAAILILVSSVQGINSVGIEPVTADSVNVNEGISLLDLDATIDNENYIINIVQPQPTNILAGTITIYVNTSAVDGRSDLNESQKTALKQHILDHIKSNFEGAVGEGNATVTDDPAQQGSADRNVSIEPGMSDPPGSAWGQCEGGNNTVKVFLGEFMNDSNVNGSFQNPDGSWNITKLGNAIGHTAGHEVAHTYSVGHNHEERPEPPDFLLLEEEDNRSKMTAGENINAGERANSGANSGFVFDDHTNDVIGNNLGKDACEAFPDYDMKVLLAHYYGPTTLPDKPDEAGSLDVTFDFYTEMSGHFELGFLGEDTDDGLHDGNSEFDFVYKTSLLNDENIDAKILTFISEFHDQTTWLLRGSEESPHPGEWFMLDENDVILSDFIETPEGDIVARKVEMSWPYQGVGVSFDALSFGEASNLYNGFTYDFVQQWEHKMHFPQLPDEDGWDVYATAGLTQPEYPQVCLADDWLCTETGPVTDIHFWGSWKGGIEGTINSFAIAIHEDIPADPAGGIPYSRPGTTLREWTFDKWDVVPVDPPCMEGWYNPGNGEVIENDHQAYFRYDIVDIPEPLIQEKGTIYWLSISAIVKEVPPPDPQPLWGWKSTEDHWNDDAVWSYWGNLNWIEMYEPSPPITNQFWIEFDAFGKPINAGGTDYFDDGTSIMNGWYFYPDTGWYNIWFYDHPFDPTRYKEIVIEFDWSPTDADYWIEFAVNWATNEWPPGSPPPIPPIGNEELYIGREIFHMPGPGSYVFDFVIQDYNPEWVSVDVMGRNIVIPGGIITHDCLPPQSLDLAFVITGEELGEWYWKPAYPNYAPSGMPDFDQKQDMWKAIHDGGNGIAETTATGDDRQVVDSGSTVTPYDVVVAPGPNCQLDTIPAGDDVEKWAFCGPTAVANCFWWFDSKYADPTGTPGDGEDEFPLVQDYSVVGVDDDHSSSNVPLLIEDLASRMQTSDKGKTHIDDMQLAIDEWFIDTGLDNMFEETTYDAPTFEFIESEIERSQDVILLLGYYDYEQGDKIVDQEQTLWEPNDNLQTVTWGDYQSFTPMVSTLDAIQLYLVSNGPSCDIEINVYDSGRNLIGSLIHNPGILQNPTWYQFHFASTIPLKDELHYFDVRQIEDGYHYEWFYMPYDPYIGGQGWMDTMPNDYNGDPFDWTFKTEYYSGGGNDCIRKGGHYVTCAGVNSDAFRIAFSDPRWDISDPSPNDHNDAQYVSHDIYGVSIGSPCPGLPYQWWLPDYPADHDYTIVEQAVVICPKPSVEIDKWVWDETTQEWVDEIDADVGETVSFKIEVHNNGGYDLTNIQVVDTLPFCLDYVDGSAVPPASVDGKIITWNFPGPLSHCNTITITFDADVVSEGDNINTVTVTADADDGTGVSDEDTAIVYATEPSVPSVDIEKYVWDKTLGDWVDYIEAEICNIIRFNLSIHNTGLVTLIVTKVWDILPPCLEYEDNATVNGMQWEPDVITPPNYEWNYPLPADYWYPGSEPGELPPGEWIYIEFDAHVISEGININEACVDADSTGGPVSDCDTATVVVGGDGIPPVISDVVLIASDPLDTELGFGWEKVTCTVRDPVVDVKMHYPQMPDPFGWDVLATFPVVLADDWMCTGTGPVTDIHFWGSWLGNMEGTIRGFWVSIHANIPGPPYSMPGELLWKQYITDFSVVLMEPSPQGWYDPFYPWWEYPNHDMYFQYDIIDIPDPFIQEEGTIYWLDISADVIEQGYPGPPLWGWKTSMDHWEDNAVWEIEPDMWYELYDPLTGESLDLAFVITGEYDEVDEVNLVVTYPDNHMDYYPMTNIPGTDTYYYNTTLTIAGCYSYHIWTDDTSGNNATSASEQFELPPNWDINMDGMIRVVDFVLVAGHYGEDGPTRGWIREDVDNDGMIRVVDFVIIAGQYGKSWERCS